MALQAEYRLRGLHRQIYEYCEPARTADEIKAHIGISGPEGLIQDGVASAVDELVSDRLLLSEDSQYLALAVAMGFQLEYLAVRSTRRLPIGSVAQAALAKLVDPRTPALASAFASRVVAESSPLLFA